MTAPTLRTAAQAVVGSARAHPAPNATWPSVYYEHLDALEAALAADTRDEVLNMAVLTAADWCISSNWQDRGARNALEVAVRARRAQQEAQDDE